MNIAEQIVPPNTVAPNRHSFDGAIYNAPSRVAVYCRVSTDKDDQANSLESQKAYFREYIEHNPNWSLIRVYAEACDIIEPTQACNPLPGKPARVSRGVLCACVTR